jgi:hypothetical protein
MNRVSRRVLDGFLAVAVIGAGLAAGLRIRSALASRGRIQTWKEDRTVEGRRLTGFPAWPDGRTTTRLVSGKPHVVYVFRTMCEYCEAQHSHIGGLLAMIPRDQVVTVAPERPGILRGYWRQVAPTLPDPIPVTQVLLDSLGLPGVPDVLVLDPTNRVVRAWAGSMATLSRDRWRHEVMAALDAKP